MIRLRVVAVDPGDVYVGVAFFEDSGGEWECVGVQETTPAQFLDDLAETLVEGGSQQEAPLDVLVYERFRLYGDKAQAQTGSEFRTSQVIGVLKWLVRKHNEHAQRHEWARDNGRMLTCELSGGTCADPDKHLHPVVLKGQVADIQKPTAGVLRARGIKSVAKPVARSEYHGRDHVVSAELHGWHWVLNGDRECDPFDV